MVWKVLLLLIGIFGFDASCAISKNTKAKIKPLRYEEMVKLGWRPTPTTAQIAKEGPFKGYAVVASAPRIKR